MMNNKQFGNIFEVVIDYYGKVDRKALTAPQIKRYLDKCNDLNIEAGRFKLICNAWMDAFTDRMPAPDKIVMFHRKLPFSKNTDPQKAPCGACEGCGLISVKIHYVGGVVFTNTSGELAEPINDLAFRCSCANADKYRDSGMRLDVAWPNYKSFDLEALDGCLRSKETGLKVILQMKDKQLVLPVLGDELRFEEPRNQFDKSDPRIRHLAEVAKRVSGKKQMSEEVIDKSKEFPF